MVTSVLNVTKIYFSVSMTRAYFPANSVTSLGQVL